jgi:hypothetical protein
VHPNRQAPDLASFLFALQIAATGSYRTPLCNPRAAAAEDPEKKAIESARQPFLLDQI